MACGVRLGTEKNKNKYAKCVAGPTTEYTMKSYDYLGGTYERKSSGTKIVFLVQFTQKLSLEAKRKQLNSETKTYRYGF